MNKLSAFLLALCILSFPLSSGLFADEVDKQIELYQKLYDPDNVKKMFKKGMDIHNGKAVEPSSNTSAESPAKSPGGSVDDQVLKFLQEKVKQRKKPDPFLWWHKSKDYIIIGAACLVLLIALAMLIKYFKELKALVSHLFLKKMSKINVSNGNRHFESGDIKESIKFFKLGMQALVHDRDSLENYIHALVDNNDISEAISSLQVLDRNFSLEKNDMLLLVSLYIKTNNTNKASETLDALFLKNSKDVDVLMQIRDYYRKLNNTFNLTDCIKKLLDFKPNDTELLNELGTLYIERNMLAEAISVFEHIKDIERDNIDCYLKIAEINLLMNNESRAIEQLENTFQYIRSFHAGLFNLLNRILDRNCKNTDAKIMLTKILYMKDPRSQKLGFLYKELILTHRSEEMIERGYKYYNDTDQPQEMVLLFEKLVESTKSSPASWAPMLIPLCVEFSNMTLFNDYWSKLDPMTTLPQAWESVKDSLERYKFFDEKTRCLILSTIYRTFDADKFVQYCAVLVQMDPAASEEMSFTFYLKNYKPDLYTRAVDNLHRMDVDNIRWIFLQMVYAAKADIPMQQFFEKLTSLDDCRMFFDLFQELPIVNTEIEYEFAVKFFDLGAQLEAVSQLTSLLERVRDTQKINYTLAKYYLAMDRTTKSRELIDRLVADHPDNMKYCKMLIQLMSAKSTSLELSRHIDTILMSEEFEKYKLFTKNILKRRLTDQRDDSIILRQLGFLYYRSESYFKSFLFFDEAIKTDPASLDRILSYFQEFPPHEPESFIYYLRLLLNDPVRLEYGLKLIETNEATIFSGRGSEHSLIKAEFLFKMGRNADALTEINRADIKELSKDLIISGMKLKSSILSANDKKKQAIELLNELETTFGNEADITTTRISLSKELYDDLYSSGMKHFENRDWNKAISKFQKFLHNNPDRNYEVRLALAVCFFEKSFFDLGLDELEFVTGRLKEGHPPDLDRLYQAAEIYSEYGYLQEAFANYKLILGHDFDFKDVSARMDELKLRMSNEGAQGSNNALINHFTAAIKDRYSHFEVIGKGGTSMVFRAYDNKLDRNVAIKVLNEEHIHDKEELKRFKRSAMAVAKFNHPNITRIYDIEETDSSSYLVMEIIEGSNLRELMSEKKLSLSDTIRILTQIAQALSYAHGYGIIHRDIKPDNITIETDSQLVKVMDFGLARIEYMSTMTKTGIKMGTPYYMSPEQIKGEVITPLSDIYSFGIMAYEMVTGSRPFTSGDLAYQHIHSIPVLPSELNPNVGVALENVIVRCIQKLPSQRIENAGVLYETLRKLKAGVD